MINRTSIKYDSASHNKISLTSSDCLVGPPEGENGRFLQQIFEYDSLKTLFGAKSRILNILYKILLENYNTNRRSRFER